MVFSSFGPIWWLIAAVLLGIVEAVSPALVSIWFCVGAAGAFVASMLGANPLVQVIVFLVLSVVGMVALRPWFKHHVSPGTPGVTDVDAMVGRIVTVTEPIEVGREGRARLADTTWFARREDGLALEKGALATVVEVDGTHLVVKPFEADGSKEQ